MQKVVDFLERYCQWVAVGVGALFFLFALSQYLPVVTTPVKTELDSQVVTPGEVDAQTVQLVADSLETSMSNPETVPIKVPNYAGQIIERASSTPKVGSLSSSMVFSQKVELPELPWSIDPAQQNAPAQIAIPVLPAAIVSTDPGPGTGFAQVTPVAPQAGVAPAANAAAANMDVTWVRIPFTISMSQMDRAFRDANIPGALSNTNFVRVELIRQRQLPNGNWGTEEVVKPIDTVTIQAVPNAQNAPQLIQFNQWAIANQRNIVQPPFYPFVSGDNPLRVAPSAVDGVAGGPAVFDPETYPANGPLDTLEPEQRKAVIAARQRKAKEAEDARRNAGGGGNQGQGGGGLPGGRGAGGPGGGGGRGPGGRSDDGSGNRSITPFQNPPPGGPGMPPGGGYPPGGYPNDGSMAGGQPNDIMLQPIADQQFIPVSGMPDIQGHAFDMSAKPGAVYRYRIRYSIMNPLFNAAAAGVGQQLAAQFEVFGEDKTKWTDPITVKSNTHVFLQSVPTAGANVVRFTVFRWQNGKWNRSNQTFSPGDSVGKVDADIDYRSMLTLVEARKDSTSERAYALLMADDGSVVKKDFDADSASQEYKDLNYAIDGPPTPTAPPEGGGYPGGGYPGGYPGGGPAGAGGPGSGPQP